MSGPLSVRFGLGASELVALVGAGGKTTTLQLLGNELAGDGAKVVLTTTTRMSESQLSELVCWSSDAEVLNAAFVPDHPLYAASEVSDGKAFGFSPETVDDIFSSSAADHVLVEADGARRMLIKAPADYEPVIPSASTTVVVVMGAGALGHPIRAVAHRPERIEALTGLTPSDVLTPEGAATVLLHPKGGLKGIPQAARAVMVITNVTDTTEPAATALAELLAANDAVERCLLLNPPPASEGAG